MVDRISGTDAYEWLGASFVVHRVEVAMGDGEVRQLEMIGPYDVERDAFLTCAYDGVSGEIDRSIATVAEDGTWTFRGGTGPSRAESKVRVADDGRTIGGTWARTTDDGQTWIPWLRMHWTRRGTASALLGREEKR